MKPVQSSHIEAIGHDGENTMVVQYKGGRQYSFPDVTSDQFAALEAAPSKGRHLRTMKISGERI
jgi:hypothetical protein